jgi:hypothetical protein
MKAQKQILPYLIRNQKYFYKKHLFYPNQNSALGNRNERKSIWDYQSRENNFSIENEYTQVLSPKNCRYKLYFRIGVFIAMSMNSEDKMRLHLHIRQGFDLHCLYPCEAAQVPRKTHKDTDNFRHGSS